MAQLAGHEMLKVKGINLIAASAPTFVVEDNHSLVRRGSSGGRDDNRHAWRQPRGYVVEF
jgi:hypothetical protein